MSNFIFDIDGTLRNFESKPNIDPSLYKYLSILNRKNSLYVVTGRTYKNFKKFLLELSKTTDKATQIDSLFDTIFCEDGHICYNNDGSNCLIDQTALEQLNKTRLYVNKFLDKMNKVYHIVLPHKDLISEITITIQEREGKASFKKSLDTYINRNKLDRLTVNILTHNRLSVSVIGIGKHSAIGHYPLDLSDSSYFCDERNDLELAKNIKGLGGMVICPINAIDEIKAVSNYVSDLPYSYGVVDYLSKYFKNSLN